MLCMTCGMCVHVCGMCVHVCGMCVHGAHYEVCLHVACSHACEQSNYPVHVLMRHACSGSTNLQPRQRCYLRPPIVLHRTCFCPLCCQPDSQGNNVTQLAHMEAADAGAGCWGLVWERCDVAVLYDQGCELGTD